MDIGEYFRSFFGLGAKQRPDFPWNIPVPGSEDDDCECNKCNENDHSSFPSEDENSQAQFFFGKGDHPLDGMFQHFHGDMHRQMEFLHRQMEDMMKGFGMIDSGNSSPPNRFGITDQPESHPNGRGERPPFFFFDFSIPGKPNFSKEKQTPRDFMLKDDEDVSVPKTLVPTPAPAPPSGESSGVFRSPFRRIFPWNQPSQHHREDTDLDGKISGADVVDLIKKSNKEKTPQNSPSQGFFSGSSVTMTTVRGHDGKVEQKKIVRDSSGREESTVTRSLDGQCHTVTTIMGPNGLEEKKEDFKNMDENDIKKFEEKWHSQQASEQPTKPAIIEPPRRHIGPSSRLDSDDWDMFSKYFRGPPK